MSEYVFIDKNKQPDEKSLIEKLEQSFNHWQSIQEYVEESYDNINNEWKFYGKNYGWQLKTFLKKIILF